MSVMVEMVILPDCICHGDIVEFMEHTIFHCAVIQAVDKFVDGYMVCLLHGQFFAL